MKGLIYKDFLLSRKYYIMAFIYCFMFVLLGVLMRISMICGNLSRNQEVLDSLGRNMYVLRYMPCLTFLFAFSVDGGAIFSDFNCNWIRFCNTSSLREKQIAGAKMISASASLTFAYIISLIYITVFCIAGGSFPDLNMILNITAMFFAVLGASFANIALSFAFRKKQTVEMISVAVIGIIGIAGSFLMMLKLNSMNMEEDFDLLDFLRSEYGWIRSYFLPAALIFMLVSGAVCFYVSTKTLKRREN